MIYYKITRKDILKASTTKWSKVLQFKFECKNYEAISKDFYAYMKELKTKVLYNSITLEEANRLIYQKVAELTEKYPKDFPTGAELGWYSKQVLAERFINGEITINNTYTVNTMVEDRLVLLQQVKEIEKNRLLQEEAAELRRLEELVEAESTRVPVKVGMLFHTKAGVVRAYLHQYPKDTKLYAIANEIGNSVKIERGKHTLGKQCWKVLEIFIDGGRAYQDDLVLTGETNE